MKKRILISMIILLAGYSTMLKPMDPDPLKQKITGKLDNIILIQNSLII